MDTENPKSELTPSVGEDVNTTPVKIAYALYAFGCIFPLLTLGGVIYAYVERGKSELNDTHLTHLIRTFWLALLISVVGVLTIVVVIGIPILIAGGIWYVLRIITGFVLFNDGKPVSGSKIAGFVAT